MNMNMNMNMGNMNNMDMDMNMGASTGFAVDGADPPPPALAPRTEDLAEVRRWTGRSDVRLAACSGAGEVADAYDGSTAVATPAHPVHHVAEVVVEWTDLAEALATLPAVGDHNALVVVDSPDATRTLRLELAAGAAATPGALAAAAGVALAPAGVAVELDAARGVLRFRAAGDRVRVRPHPLLGVWGEGLTLLRDAWVPAHRAPRTAVRVAYLTCAELASAFTTSAPFGECLVAVPAGTATATATATAPVVLRAAAGVPLARVSRLTLVARDVTGAPLRDMRLPWTASVTLRAAVPENLAVDAHRRAAEEWEHRERGRMPTTVA